MEYGADRSPCRKAFTKYVVDWREKQGKLQESIQFWPLRDPSILSRANEAYVGVRNLAAMVSKASKKRVDVFVAVNALGKFKPKSHKFYNARYRYKTDKASLNAVLNRIAVLLGGRIRQVDSREAVLTRPVDAEAAILVGMTNLLRATLDAEGTATLEDGRRIQTSRRGGSREEVCIGFRPEHLKLDVGRGEGVPIGEGIIEERVSDGVLTTLTIAFGTARLRTHLVSGRGMARELSAGDRISLSLRPEDVHVLPR